MSTPDDGTLTAPDGGSYPGEQPPGQAGYGRPGFGPPEYDPASYGHQQQYGGPGYGPPPYAQAPYQPGYGPPPGYGYGRPTNSLAMLSLVLAFVFAPAGLVTGIIARRQIRETNEDGDGLALAGIIVGGIVTGLFLLVIVFWMIALVALTNEL